MRHGHTAVALHYQRFRAGDQNSNNKTGLLLLSYFRQFHSTIDNAHAFKWRLGNLLEYVQICLNAHTPLSRIIKHQLKYFGREISKQLEGDFI